MKKHRCRFTLRKHRFQKVTFFTAFCCFLFTLCISVLLFPPGEAAAVHGWYSESFSALEKGKDLLEKGKYGEALESLETAYARLPVIGDYTLFFMAKAYNRMERFDDSSRRIDTLLITYPDSPLKKRARALQIDNILLNRDTERQTRSRENGLCALPSLQKSEEALRYLEAYVADYPDDAEMTFFTARLLKKLGKTDRAKKLFVTLYAGNNAFSELAHEELRPADITPEVMFTKASNLIKAFEYKKAEAILRKIPAARDPFREDIQKALGQALFRQKRYREAIEAFSKAGDIYNAARSSFRSGELGAFREMVSRLVAMEDKRAGSLLIAYAAKKRRDGRTEEALDVFQDVGKRYPSLAEDALWGVAWTYYRGGDFKKAADVLTTLNDRYPNSRYSYWKQRSIEQDSRAVSSESRSEGQAAVNSLEGQNRKNLRRDFYSILAYVKDMDNFSGRSLSPATWRRSERTLPDSGPTGLDPNRLPPEILPSYERFSILMELGMKEDAVGELVRISNRVSRPDLLISLCRTLQGVGAYKRSIGLIARFSDEKGPKWGDGADVADILYPLAYWPTVSEISEHYTLDPFLLLAVIREESRFDPYARSVAGALGLMQIMPHTAFSLDNHLKMDIADAAEIYNIRTNITVGAYYLNSLLKEFGSLPVALAAYNAGHDKAREWVKEGNYRSYDEFIEDIPYEETRNYVKRVLLTYFTYMSLGNRE